MNYRRLGAVIAASAVAAGGLGGGLALAFGGSSGPNAPSSATAATTSPSATEVPPYSWYRSMMGGFLGSSMMRGSSSSWMGRGGYAWMLGGISAPGWMRGQSLPAFMMESATDPGSVMGSLWANAPAPRVSAAQARRLGAQTPAGATLDRAGNRITFTTSTVNLVVEASPSMPAESFRIADMTNPTIVVPAGARVSIELINADSDMAHGLVVTASGAASSWMPMMAAQPAFAGGALWFLGESTSAGMHEGTLSFTATTPGTYQYLCPVPGHAQEGMAGTFVVG